MTTTTDNAAEILDPTPQTFTLTTGREVRVQRLKMRQLMRAARIITHGAGDAIGALSLESPDDFIASIGPIIFASVPDAEQETVDFIISMVEPVGIIAHPKTEADKKHNVRLYGPMIDDLSNPDIEDVFSIFEAVFENERPYLESLGKRLSALVTMETKVEEKKAARKTTPK